MSHSSGEKNKRLVGLFLLGVLFFNFPLLSLFNHKSYVLGFPLLYLYIFGVWVLMIVLMMFTTSRSRLPENRPPES
ncbi:MAG: hypothetical protein LJE94_19305 [Deltaproteobacteria bacterium]|nr:hypothetical protein [Deltaproteobacteria bacterium]